MALRQTGTVTEYREKFESMLAPLNEASNEMLMGVFRNGLKEEIRAELRIMKFGSLQELMDLAHNVEERNIVVEKNREDFLAKHLKTAIATKWNMAKPNGGWTWISGGLDPVHTTTYNLSMTKAVESKPVVNEKQSTNIFVSLNHSKMTGMQVRRLTDAKIAKKRSLGLCYRCDEKYSPTHRCKNRQLQVMILQPCEGEDYDELYVAAEKEEDTQVLELSMNSVVGLTGNHAMKLKGRIKDEEILILIIDIGATHNFIASELVERSHSSLTCV